MKNIASISLGDVAALAAAVITGLSFLIGIAVMIYRAGQNNNRLAALENDTTNKDRFDLLDVKFDNTFIALTNRVTNFIEPELKNVRERMASMESTVAGLTQTHSPIGPTDKGMQGLRDSGLQDFLDDNKELLTTAITGNGELTNPYDIQKEAIDFMDAYTFPDDLNEQIKTYAFNHGISVEALRYIAALYVRDLYLKDVQ